MGWGSCCEWKQAGSRALIREEGGQVPAIGAPLLFPWGSTSESQTLDILGHVSGPLSTRRGNRDPKAESKWLLSIQLGWRPHQEISNWQTSLALENSCNNCVPVWKCLLFPSAKSLKCPCCWISPLSHSSHSTISSAPQWVPEKHLLLLFLTTPKPLTVWITTNLEHSERDGHTRPPDLPPEKSACRSRSTVRTGHGTTDWFQIGKGVVKAVYCHPAYLTSMQSTSWETLDWKEETQAGIKIAGRNINNLNNLKYADDSTLMAESEEELKSLLTQVKEESKKLA